MFDDKRLVRLYIPVFIEQALATLIAMIGTMMVSGIGPAAVSGVSLVDSINMLVMNVFTAVATGVTVAVSQYIGAKDYDSAGRAAQQSVVIAVEVSAIVGVMMIIFARPILKTLFSGAEEDVISSAVTFLIASSITMPFQALYATSAGITRASGDSKSPMFASLLANIGYIATATILIQVFHVGVVGAGIGLGVSRVISSAVMYFRLMRNSALPMPKLSLKPDFAILRPVLKIALPTGADAFLFNCAKIVVQVFMSGMGTAALAANSIVSSLSGFINLPGNALSIVSMTVIGQTFGAGEVEQTGKHMKRLTVIGCGLLLVACGIMYLFVNRLIGLYSPVAATWPIAEKTLKMVLIASPLLWVPSFCLPNMLRSTGDTTFTMTVSVASVFILRITGAWLFGVYLGWGIFGIWFSMLIDWAGRGAFFVPRMFSGKWKKNVPAGTLSKQS